VPQPTSNIATALLSTATETTYIDRELLGTTIPVLFPDACEHVLFWRRWVVTVLDGVGLAKFDELVGCLGGEHLAAAVAGQAESHRFYLPRSWVMSVISAFCALMMA
jgi:hypothetical protein